MWQPDLEEPNGGVGDVVLGLRGATKTVGGITGREGETLKAGRLGDYRIRDHGGVMLGPDRIVTPEDIKEFPL